MALITLWPEAWAVAMPVGAIVAVLLSLLSQLTWGVRFCVLPSVSVAVAVKAMASPEYAVGVCGDSVNVVTSGGITAMLALALPPFSSAVMFACPGALAETGNSAKSAPAAMLTVGGTEAMALSLELKVTAVALLGARDTATLSVPGVPLGRVRAVWVMLVITGG